MTAIPTCPACEQPMDGHPICVMPRCRCLMHKGVWSRDPQLCKACDKALFQRGYRRCRTCETIKPLEKFQKKPGTYYRDCRSCRGKRPTQRAHAQRCRALHQERYRAAARARYHADPERHRARHRASYKKHREKRHLYAAAWHRAHRAQHLQQVRDWRARNRERVLASERARYQRRKIKAWFGTKTG